ncbi:MAG TPA: hypothetical protein QF353_05210 [Gammaproteobacteria bacterium]|nr:hypothetical protein [Gammaproteobacteria bacterium]
MFLTHRNNAILWSRFLSNFSHISAHQFQNKLSVFPVEVIKRAVSHGLSPLFIANQSVREINLKLESWLSHCQQYDIPLDQPALSKTYYQKPYHNTALHEWLANEYFDTAQQALKLMVQKQLHFNMSSIDSEGKTPLALALIVNSPNNLIRSLLTTDNYHLGFDFTFNASNKGFSPYCRNVLGLTQSSYSPHQPSHNLPSPLTKITLTPFSIAWITGNIDTLNSIQSHSQEQSSLYPNELFHQNQPPINLLNQLTYQLLESCSIDANRGVKAQQNILILDNYLFYIIHDDHHPKLKAHHLISDKTMTFQLNPNIAESLHLTYDETLTSRYPKFLFLLNSYHNIKKILSDLETQYPLHINLDESQENLLQALRRYREERMGELSLIDSLEAKRDKLLCLIQQGSINLKQPYQESPVRFQQPR